MLLVGALVSTDPSVFLAFEFEPFSAERSVTSGFDSPPPDSLSGSIGNSGVFVGGVAVGGWSGVEGSLGTVAALDSLEDVDDAAPESDAEVGWLFAGSTP
jgi:hypothetical protein